MGHTDGDVAALDGAPVAVVSVNCGVGAGRAGLFWGRTISPSGCLVSNLRSLTVAKLYLVTGHSLWWPFLCRMLVSP